jgi:hypothetical protein
MAADRPPPTGGGATSFTVTDIDIDDLSYCYFHLPIIVGIVVVVDQRPPYPWTPFI